MNIVKIEGTSVTPRVYFSVQERLLEVSGYSRPENARDFYYPLLQWLDEFKEWYKNKIKITEEESQFFSFKFKYVYFNSSSAKFIYDLILVISDLQKSGIPIKIYWYFDEDDDELREAGEELSDMANVQMNYVEVSHM